MHDGGDDETEVDVTAGMGEEGDGDLGFDTAWLASVFFARFRCKVRAFVVTYGVLTPLPAMSGLGS